MSTEEKLDYQYSNQPAPTSGSGGYNLKIYEQDIFKKKIRKELPYLGGTANRKQVMQKLQKGQVQLAYCKNQVLMQVDSISVSNGSLWIWEDCKDQFSKKSWMAPSHRMHYNLNLNTRCMEINEDLLLRFGGEYKDFELTRYLPQSVILEFKELLEVKQYRICLEEEEADLSSEETGCGEEVKIEDEDNLNKKGQESLKNLAQITLLLEWKELLEENHEICKKWLKEDNSKNEKKKTVKVEKQENKMGNQRYYEGIKLDESLDRETSGDSNSNSNLQSINRCNLNSNNMNLLSNKNLEVINNVANTYVKQLMNAMGNENVAMAVSNITSYLAINQPTCFNCGVRGHTKNACTAILCYYCKKQGHVSKDCTEFNILKLTCQF